MHKALIILQAAILSGLAVFGVASEHSEAPACPLAAAPAQPACNAADDRPAG